MVSLLTILSAAYESLSRIDGGIGAELLAAMAKEGRLNARTLHAFLPCCLTRISLPGYVHVSDELCARLRSHTHVQGDTFGLKPAFIAISRDVSPTDVTALRLSRFGVCPHMNIPICSLLPCATLCRDQLCPV